MAEKKKDAAKTAETINERKSPTIYTKLLEFQKKKISIVKSETNPHFKNKYADINEVLDKVKPALSELGIVITQIPLATGLKSILYDTESDTQIESYLQYTVTNDPQKMGSNITYFRRYSLVAMLGLEDGDDDGNGGPEQKAPPAKSAAPKKIEISIAQAMAMLSSAVSQEALKAVWISLSPALRADPEVEAMKNERKDFITNQEY